jgi:hypothetical protein
VPKNQPVKGPNKTDDIEDPLAKSEKITGAFVRILIGFKSENRTGIPLANSR